MKNVQNVYIKGSRLNCKGYKIQGKLMWNLNNVRCKTIGYFRNMRQECLKDKINDCETTSKNECTRDLSRDINEFKNGYRPRTALVKNEKGEMFADSHSVLNR